MRVNDEGNCFIGEGNDDKRDELDNLAERVKGGGPCSLGAGKGDRDKLGGGEGLMMKLQVILSVCCR